MESPHSLERYDLTAHLARGGMADVFRATDKMLNREVAVKILHQRYAETDSFVARFRNEAQAAANLTHPNIVSIYDWGHEDGTYYIVMELVKGRSLHQLVKSEGRILPRRAVEIAAEIAAALEVAHRNRVIHRDIKPGNVLLSEEGLVKVTDFGVARAWDDSQDLTRTGAVIGTATYFSPEQARGDLADERSDIYSLGVVLYEMLVGRPPFSGETPVSVAYQHVTAEVPSPGALNTDVPLELEAIVMKCLSKDPARRYESAAEIRLDLLLFLQGKSSPTAASTPSQPQPATQPAPRSNLPPPTVSPDEMYRRVQATPRPPSQVPFVITSIALAALVVVGAWYLIRTITDDPAGPTTTTGTTTIEVPDVIGRPEDEARQMLQESGFQVEPRAETSDSEAGTVIQTEPRAGEAVDETTRVTMVVSSGPARIQIPGVIGSTRDRAEGILQGQGLTIGSISSIAHATVGEGLVISQNPPAGVEAPTGSTVDLVVSAGPEPIETPSVVGLTRDRAEGILQGLGLEVETVVAFDNEVEEELVVSQSPTAGADVNPGWTVQLVISAGPEEIELEEPSGQPVDEVAAALTESGMLVVIQAEGSAEVPAGLVIRTEPPSGTLLAVGDQVIVVESSGIVLVTVPDLAGATPEAAEESVTALGLRLEIASARSTVTDPALVGRIIRQAPSAGDQVVTNQAILVVLGELPTEDSEEDG